MGKTYNGCVDLARSRTSNTAKIMEDALQWHQTGHLQLAEQLYRQILQANPNHPAALHCLGQIAHQTGHYKAGAEMVSKAIANDSGVPDFYNTLAAIFSALGELQKAVSFCQKALSIKSDYAEAHSNLGLLLHLQGRHDEAIESSKRAVSLNPGDVKAYSTIAAAMQAQGHYSEAIKNFEQVIRLNPNFAAAYNNLGNILQQQGQQEEAIANYREAIKLEPANANAYNNLANVLKTQGMYGDAIENYQKAIRLEPDSAVIYNNLGVAHTENGAYGEAIINLKQAIKLKPDYAEAYGNLGNSLKELGRLDEAVESCRRAIGLGPDCAIGYNYLGASLYKQDRFEESIENFKRAIQLQPDIAEAYSNLGAIFFKLGRYDEAMENCERAIQLKPDYTEAYNTLGSILHNQRQYDKAVTNFDKAIQLKPDYASAYSNRAYTFLLTGDFAKGWEDYWWRRKLTEKSITQYPRKFPVPLWDGASLANKKLLVHYEQGAGDNIQFIRYLPFIKSRGATVIFEAPKSISGLLQNFDGIDELIETPADGKLGDVECDYYVPLMDIPRIFGTDMETIPAEIPYLYGDPAKVKHWKSKLPDDKFKVGIVWAGSPTHCNDHNRSCHLKQFAPLANIPGVGLYSLQKGPATAQIEEMINEMSVVNLGEEFKDFTDTAAAIENMDLVISVDTSVLHLAGAMGKPTWALISYVPDWRWLLDREDSPWYPAVKLFRQKELGDWDDVTENLTAALEKTVKEKLKRV